MRAAASTLEAEPTPVPPAAPAAAVPAPARYWAFLSYSHRDRRAADRLHKALERYRLPSDVVGTHTRVGPVPRRLHPIFRDREELTASADLDADVQRALAESRALLVLCSPAAAASRWANAEISLFRRLHPNAPVLAAIISGEPWASEIPGREAEECFPLALRRRWDKRGRITGARAEPVAADLRPDGDGRTLGKLKLVAGLLGLPLDQLAKREERLQRRRLAGLAAAGLIGTAVTGGLAVAAADARDEARDQREAAEGLVAFMLGDLRAKLEPLGRLDALDSVGARTLAYFEGQDRDALSDNALGQRARALHLIGEIANTRGDLATATRHFREAERSTAAALARDPRDPQRMFDHAQSVFWLSALAMQQGRLQQAEQGFRQYKRLADRLIAIDPRSPKWRLEGVYANSNLGALLLRQQHYDQAETLFASALKTSERLAALEPDNPAHRVQSIETLGVLSEAREGAGRLAQAESTRERQRQLIDGWLAEKPGDMVITRKALAAERAMSRLRTFRGDTAGGVRHARKAVEIAQQLVRAEPDNAEWLTWGSRAQLDLAELMLQTGEDGDAGRLAITACGPSAMPNRRASDMSADERYLALRCLQLRARLASIDGAHASALALARDALTIARSQQVGGREEAYALAWAQALVGDMQAAGGDLAAARASWSSALSSLPPGTSEAPLQAARRHDVLRRLGRTNEASRIREHLTVIGFKHPAYVT